MTNGMNMFLIQCWRMKDAKSCGTFSSKLKRLLNIDGLVLYEGCKILCDFPIQTDKFIKHRRTDIVCIDKKNSKNLLSLIIDLAMPRDQIPEYHREITGKVRQVQRFANRIGETMEI